MAGPADWIAAATFVIAVSAFVSNILVLWLKWPRIIVEVAARHNGEPLAAAPPGATLHSQGEVFLLSVTNNGSEPVTLTSVGLIQHGRGAHRLDYLHTWRGPSADRLPIAHGAEGLLAMPLRIDAHSCHVFEYLPSALAEVPAGVRYHGYAQRYKGYRWLPNHPVVHETHSKHTVTRTR